MNCAEFEVLLCDYLDRTADAETRRTVEEHMRGCAACAEFARDVQGAVAFIERVEAVEPPPELLTKITFDIPSGGAAVRKGFRAWLMGWLQPVLQPRFAMGMAMTILSFSMLGRLVGINVQELKPSDLQPAAILSAVDNRVHRTWDRAVKYYENLRLVYEVQSRLQDWTKQEEEERHSRTLEENPGAPSQKTDKKEREQK